MLTEKTAQMKLDEAIAKYRKPSGQTSYEHGGLVVKAYEDGQIADMEAALYIIAGLLEQ